MIGEQETNDPKNPTPQVDLGSSRPGMEFDSVLDIVWSGMLDTGFSGSRGEFFTLLCTDPEVLDLSFDMMSSTGFKGTKDELAGLLGIVDPEPVKKKEDTDLKLEDTSLELPKIEVPEVKTGTTAETDIIDPEEEIYNKAGKGEAFLNFFSQNIDAGLAQGNSVSEVVELMKQGKNFTPEDVDELIKSAEQMENLPPSEEMIKFTKAVEENGGDNFAFLKTLADFDDDVNSFKVLAETGIRSFVGMGKAAYEEPLLTAGAGVFSGIAGGPTGTVVGAMSAAGGLMETSVSFIEFLKEELGDKDFNRENVIEILNDDEKRKSIRNRALVRGGTTALFDLIGGGIATEAAGRVAKLAQKTTSALGKAAGKAGAVTAAGVIEGVSGGAGEATARAFAGQEYSAIETGLETFGGASRGLVTGPLGIAKTYLENTPYYKNLSKGIASYELNGKTVNKEQIEEFIDSSTPEEVDMFLKKTNLVINNDNELSNKIENKRKRFKISKDVVSDPAGKNTEKIIDLELELDALSNKKTESARLRREDLKQQIKELQSDETPATEQQETVESEEAQQPAEEKKSFNLFEEDGTTEFVKPEGSDTFEIGSKKQTLALVDGKGKLIASFDSKTGKKRKTNTLAEKELVQEYDYTKGRKAAEVDPDGAKEAGPDVNEFVAEKSENAQEVAQALQTESKVDTSQTVDPIFEYIAGTKIDPKQFFERTGYKREDVSAEVQRSWFKKGGETLDQLAQGVEMDGGMSVTEDELVQIILDNPSNRIKKKTRTYDALLNKFKNLTGFTGSTKTIDAVANQEPGKLRPIDEPAELIEEQARERDIAEKTIQREDQAQQQQQETEPEIFENQKKPSSIEVLETHMDAAEKKLKGPGIISRAKKFIKEAPRAFKRRIIDRQADIKRIFRGLGDKFSIRALNLTITKAGAGSLASQVFKNFSKEIYDGLNQKQRKALDSIIYLRRIVSINENRRQKRAQASEYESQYGSELTPDQAKSIDKDILDFYYERNEETGFFEIKDFNPYSISTEGKLMNEDVARDALEQIKKAIGEEEYNQIFDRSDKYFESTRSLLGRLLDSGRITQGQFDYFKDINYSPFRVIEKIFPESGQSLAQMTEKEKAEFLRMAGRPAKDIMTLTDGGEYTVMKDSSMMLAMYTSSVIRRSFQNKLLNAIYSSFTANAQNPMLQEYMTFDRNVAEEKGFKPVGLYVNGERKTMYLSDTAAEQILNLGSANTTRDKIVSTVSGANLIRFFATGANPFFFIANVPMDFVNIVFFTDAYNRGIEQFKPVAMFKLARDFSLNLAGKIKSDLTGKGKFKENLEEAVEYGMGFDFLSQDGKSKRVKGASTYSKFVDLLAYTGTSSEQAMRLSVYLKTKKDKIADYIKENGVEPTGEALEDIKYASAAEARETIDFSQGGSLTKELDKAMPYLNATVQGARRPFKYMSENTFGFTSSIVQLAFMGAGMTALNSILAGLFFEDDEKEEILRKLREETSPYERTNYFLVLNPINPYDEKGNVNYIRIRKLPTIAPISYIGEEIMNSYYSGKEFDFGGFQRNIQAALPISGSLIDNIGYNPTASAISAYAANYDLFRKQKVFRDDPNAPILDTAEGMYDEDVATLYKYFGYGSLDVASPKRLQAAVEKFITSPSTNPMVGAGYATAELISKLSKEGADLSLVKDGYKTFFNEMSKTASRRMFRSTNPRVKEYQTLDNLEADLKKINTELYLKESELKSLISEHKKEVGIDNINPKVVPEKINDFINEKFKTPDDRRRLKDKTLRKLQLPSVSSIYFDLVFADNPQSKALIMRAIYGDQIDVDERKELNRLTRLITGRTLEKRAFFEYNKLIKE